MADDVRHMRRALRLAGRAAGRTSPNPLVGTVVVQDDRVVGEGYHHAAGEPHAEVNALRRAGAAARGATLYTNLEPCAHTGRTPPCVDAVKQAGIARVVAAMKDPDPRTNGRGFRALRDAGIAIEEGLLREEAMRLNEGFISRVTRGRPFVLLKLATTLDGRVAVPGRRYLSGKRALREAPLCPPHRTLPYPSPPRVNERPNRAVINRPRQPHLLRTQRRQVRGGAVVIDLLRPLGAGITQVTPSFMRIHRSAN